MMFEIKSTFTASKVVELHGRMLIFPGCDTQTHSQDRETDTHRQTQRHIDTDIHTHRQTQNELQLTQVH